MADLKTLMEDIARAIRLKTGVGDKINAQDFPQKIREIPQGESSSFLVDIVQADEVEIAPEIDPDVNVKLSIEGMKAKIIGEGVKETVTHLGTYLRGTGTQYIDTGIICLTGYKVEIDFQHEEIKDNTWFFGVGMGWEAGTYNSVLYTGAGFTYSGKIMERCIATGTCTSNQSSTSYLFGRHWSGEIQPSKIRIYSCKTYNENEELIQELIPAFSQEEGEHQGEACMFDTVTQTYFYNIGSGSFSYVEDIETSVTAPVGAELSIESDEFDVNSCLYNWIDYEGEKKYSHTPNITDKGVKNGSYSHNYNKTEVVTIENATQLNIKVKWGTESLSCDWLCIYKGNHPDYTASTGGYVEKVGGTDGEKELIIKGDSATFCFRSDHSGVGSGYGYYAIITGAKIISNETVFIVSDQNNSVSCVLEGTNEYFGSTETATIIVRKATEVIENENDISE